MVIDWLEIGTLVGGMLLTMLLLAVEHWFPWVEHPLPRIKAYSYGVAAILAGFWMWRLLNDDWLTPAGLTLISLAGGLMVILAYRWDGTVRQLRQARKAEAVDDELAFKE
jgi:hypothetical protein